MRVAVLALIAVSSSGCSMRAPAAAASSGGAPAVVVQSADPIAADRQMVFQDHQQLVDVDSQIEELTSRGDCGNACQAGEQMCRLGDRICDIAGRHPEDPELTDRCADASTRCERARGRLGEVCGCPPAGAIE